MGEYCTAQGGPSSGTAERKPPVRGCYTHSDVGILPQGMSGSRLSPAARSLQLEPPEPFLSSAIRTEPRPQLLCRVLALCTHLPPPLAQPSASAATWVCCQQSFGQQDHLAVSLSLPREVGDSLVLLPTTQLCLHQEKHYWETYQHVLVAVLLAPGCSSEHQQRAPEALDFSVLFVLAGPQEDQTVQE